LSARPEPGDGEVSRVVREVQRQFFDPPDLSCAARAEVERRRTTYMRTVSDRDLVSATTAAVAAIVAARGGR
jgi:hypothetical protein